MNDQTAQDPQDPGAVPAQPSSYVDEYVPPTSDTKLSGLPLDEPNNLNSIDNTNNVDDINTSQVSPMIVEDDDSNEVVELDVDSKTDKDEPLLEKKLQGSDDINMTEEDIESQNIFIMLGVEAGDDDLKEKFLDQLQDVIWEDFLSNDVELLLTQEEMTKFKVFKDKVDSSKDDAQEEAKDKMVEFLEKLIPDLEDIMLEKALDLKADLFAERIGGMKEYYSDKPEQLAEVNQAETMMFEDKWKSAAMTLNDIKE